MAETVARHKGYEIVRSDWTTELPDGRLMPVFVIPGLKERPSRPFLTSVAEAREYIDEEMRAREDARESRAVEWEGVARAQGSGIGVSVPATLARRLGLEVGDEVRVRVERLRREPHQPMGRRSGRRMGMTDKKGPGKCHGTPARRT